MRRILTTTLFPILSLLLLAAAPGEGSVITVQWSGPSEAAWDAAMEPGGTGEVEDSEFYKGCQVQFGPFCHYFWNQGLVAGGVGSPPPELFVSENGQVGFGMNFIQSMPDFFISPECKAFDPCYSSFTPLSIDWDFYGGSGGLSPFVWLSSKGGEFVVDGDWDGQFLGLGPQWQNVQWIQGVYGCLHFQDPDLECTDDFGNPYIRGMSIRVPEPSTFLLWSVALASVSARLLRRRRHSTSSATSMR
jgi:hypothetical protein